MEYCGTTSFFMRVLLDKKYALPYRVIDALVSVEVRSAYPGCAASHWSTARCARPVPLRGRIKVGNSVLSVSVWKVLSRE